MTRPHAPCCGVLRCGVLCCAALRCAACLRSRVLPRLISSSRVCRPASIKLGEEVKILQRKKGVQAKSLEKVQATHAKAKKQVAPYEEGAPI